MRKTVGLGVMALCAAALLAGGTASAQKPGGTLRIFHRDSPANMSIHEEGTISVVAPIMPVFNNLCFNIFNSTIPVFNLILMEISFSRFKTYRAV